MPAITHASASAAILTHVNEGRLTQREWHAQASDGRELACLLGAIHPSVTSPAECNGDLMPMWLAELVPVLFDGLLADRIYPQARRFGELVARWHLLTSAQWDAIEVRFKIKAIEVAVEAARPTCEGKPYWPRVVAAAGQVIKALNGDGDLAAARAAAWAEAARAAAWAADAAEAAAYDKLFTFLLDQIEAEIG